MFIQVEKEIWIFRGGGPVRVIRCSGDGAHPEDRIAHRDMSSHHCVSFKSGVQAESVVRFFGLFAAEIKPMFCFYFLVSGEYTTTGLAKATPRVVTACPVRLKLGAPLPCQEKMLSQHKPVARALPNQALRWLPQLQQYHRSTRDR